MREALTASRFVGRRLRRVLVCAPLVLAACANPFADDAPTFDEILAAGWLEDEQPPVPLDPLYCYDTIGAEDCHEAPLEDGGNRLIGYQGPPPPIDIQP